MKRLAFRIRGERINCLAVDVDAVRVELAAIHGVRVDEVREIKKYMTEYEGSMLKFETDDLERWLLQNSDMEIEEVWKCVG